MSDQTPNQSESNLKHSTLDVLERLRESQSSKIKYYVSIGVLSAVILAVWVFFSIPVIFFYLQEGIELTMDAAANNSIPVNSALSCSPNFFFNEQSGLCSPVCGEWEEFPHSAVVGFTTLTTTLYTIHIIGTVLALTLSCYNYKVMFTFPSILLVYHLVSQIILDVECFIRFAAFKQLLCSSRDLLETFQHSTSFCTFSGIVNNFIFTMITYWWLFHTVTIFWKVWFPIHARNFRISGYTSYLHLTFIVVTVLLSIVPIAAELGTGGYIITSSPPSLNFCYPRSSAAFFYSFIFHYSVIISVGVTFNLLTFWKLVRMNNFLSKQSNNFRPESKLLIFFLYYAFAVALSFILFTIGSRNAVENQQGLMGYFVCEAFGSDQADPCVLEVDRRADQAFTSSAFFAYSLGPWATLIFIVPIGKLKRKWKAWREKVNDS